MMGDYLYILKHYPGWLRLPVYKIGITGNMQARERQIEESGVDVRVVYRNRFWNARGLEKSLHHRFRSRNVMMSGSGKTEWFSITGWEVWWLTLYLEVVGLFQRIVAVFVITAVLHFALT